MNTGEQSGQAHIDSPLTHGSVHTLAPPRCRFAAIYLIAACAFPGGFLYNRKVLSTFLLYKKQSRSSIEVSSTMKQQLLTFFMKCHKYFISSIIAGLFRYLYLQDSTIRSTVFGPPLNSFIWDKICAISL